MNQRDARLWRVYVPAMLALAIILVSAIRYGPDLRSTLPRHGVAAPGQEEGGPGRGRGVAGVGEEAGRTMAPREATNLAGVEMYSVRGRVLEDLFGVPLAAWVEPDLGPVVFSNPLDGGFSLRPASAGARRVRVHAQGFEARVVNLDGSPDQELEVRLTSSTTAAVVVEFSDGTPVQGLPVTWRAAVDRPERQRLERWIDTAAQNQGTSIESVTDSRGRSGVALSTRALVSVEHPSGSSSKNLWVFPGEEHGVVLPRAPLRLQFVDSIDRSPVPGLEAQVWFPGEMEATTVSIRSDQDGYAELAASTFPILVRRPGPEVWQGSLIPLSPGSSTAGFGGKVRPMVRIDSAPDSGTISIGVCAENPRIRLLNADTLEPVHGLVRIESLPRGPGLGKPTARTARSPYHLHGPGIEPLLAPPSGIVTLPSTIPDSEELLRGVHPTRKLVIVAAGFHRFDVEVGSASADGAGGLATFLLDPAPSRRLRIEYTDGRPFQEGLTIYSQEPDVLVYSTVGEPNGILGPFDWYGGPLNSGTRWEVSEEELASQQVVTLTIPSGKGAIEVVGIPEHGVGVPLFAQRGIRLGSSTYYASLFESGIFRFDGLPQGAYLIGPHEWLRGAELGMVSVNPGGRGGPNPARAIVRPGETTRVSWIDTWVAGREIQGQVRLEGFRDTKLFLFPLYGPGHGDAMIADDVVPAGPPRLLFCRRSPRIPLDVEGRYTIRAGDPVPTLMAVCAANETRWGDGRGLYILEVILPGESVDIPVASIELSWRGELPEDLILVSFLVELEKLRHPVRAYETSSRRLWYPGRPLRIDGIPVHVRRLRVHGRDFGLDLQPGELKRIEMGPE